MLSRTESAKAGVLVGVSCLLWLAVAMVFGRPIATSLVPLLKWEITQLAPRYHVVDLRAAQAGSEASFVLRVTTTQSRSSDGRTLPAGAALSSSTLIAHLFQPFVVMLSVVSAAAMLRRRQALTLVVATVPSALGLVMLDVPFVLVGAIDDLVFSNMSPGQSHASPWVTWMNLLNGGGRVALGIGAALAVIIIAQRMAACPDHCANLPRRTSCSGSVVDSASQMTRTPRRTEPGESSWFWIPTRARMGMMRKSSTRWLWR